MVPKIYSKIYPLSCTNIHRDITNLVNQWMVRNTKTWTSWEQNITFLQNKIILNLCHRLHILRSYNFVAEETIKPWNTESKIWTSAGHISRLCWMTMCSTFTTIHNTTITINLHNQPLIQVRFHSSNHYWAPRFRCPNSKKQEYIRKEENKKNCIYCLYENNNVNNKNSAKEKFLS